MKNSLTARERLLRLIAEIACEQYDLDMSSSACIESALDEMGLTNDDGLFTYSELDQISDLMRIV